MSDPPKTAPPPLNETFETISPALAAALIVAGQLHYSHCNLHPDATRVIFVFEDPLHIGDELQRRYVAGLFPLVHAKMLAEARGYLADESYRLKGGRDANKAL
jgi:hypothetical protein